LTPGIDILAWLAPADAEASVIVQQDDEAGARKSLGKPRKAVIACAGISMRHRDGRTAFLRVVGQIEPSAELNASIDHEPDIRANDQWRSHFVRGFRRQALPRVWTSLLASPIARAARASLGGFYGPP
jgi:hypothetical protein